MTGHRDPGLDEALGDIEAAPAKAGVALRNTGELMWRNAKVLQSGTVDVVVHPPIRCDWSDDEFTQRVADVRQLYVDTLEDWPAA